MSQSESDSRAQHIGIVACSAEGAALCYRTICGEAPTRMGQYAHPELSMHTHPFAAYMKAIERADWAEVARLMVDSAQRLARVGAELAICPDNTVHEPYDEVVARSPIPWLHIAQVVARAAQRQGLSKLGVLGTRYLMEGPVYTKTLGAAGLTTVVPDEADRERINGIIFDELVHGIVRPSSRAYLNEVMARLADAGADGVVLGCTEIPLLVIPEVAPLPTLDSTRLLARAALEHALAGAKVG